MKKFKDFLEEGPDKVSYQVVRLGGSIGGKNIHSKRELKGMQVNPKDVGFETIEDAKAKVKSMNKLLSPGEKKYYGIKYVAVEVHMGKYTGK